VAFSVEPEAIPPIRQVPKKTFAGSNDWLQSSVWKRENGGQIINLIGSTQEDYAWPRNMC
jgi:hypothetical protein